MAHEQASWPPRVPALGIADHQCINNSAIICRSALWSSDRLSVKVRFPDGAGGTVATSGPFALLGSAAEAEVVLPHHEVPRKGLFLHADRHGLRCLAVDPRISQPALAGDLPVPILSTIFQGFSLEVEVASDRDAEAPRTAAPPSQISVRSEPSLQIGWHGGQRLGEFRITRALTLVGRTAPSKLRLRHKSVSKAHCVFYWDGCRLWVIDLHSRSGTWLGGQAVQACEVRVGDAIEVGEFSLRHGPADDQIAPTTAQLAEWCHAQLQASQDLQGLLWARIVELESRLDDAQREVSELRGAVIQAQPAEPRAQRLQIAALADSSAPAHSPIVSPARETRHDQVEERTPSHASFSGDEIEPTDPPCNDAEARDDAGEASSDEAVDALLLLYRDQRKLNSGRKRRWIAMISSLAILFAILLAWPYWMQLVERFRHEIP